MQLLASTIYPAAGNCAA